MKRWSEAIAVGSLSFVETLKQDLGVKAMHREVSEVVGGYELRERTEAYAANFTRQTEALSSENTILWNESVENTAT